MSDGGAWLSEQFIANGFAVTHQQTHVDVTRHAREATVYKSKDAIAEGRDRWLQSVVNKAPKGASVVGDISFASTSLIEALLEREERVRAIIITHDPIEFATRHLHEHPRAPPWEAILLAQHGFSGVRPSNRTIYRYTI